MHQTDLLVDIILIFTVALLSNLLIARLRQPTILGYILGGLIIGPHGLGFVSHHELEFFAEVGVVLLLFTLGIEFSIDKIKRIKTIALGGGSLEVGLIVLISTGAALALGWTVYRGIYLGCILALSSSAIVLKLLQESGELDTLHGRISLGILLFQDLALVPIMIVLPALATPENSLIAPLAMAAGKAALFLAGALLVSRFVLPFLFRQITRTGSRELFLIMVLALSLGTAWVSNQVGLSLALGAFIAGIVVSNSEYSLRILSDVLPFKDIFLCVFFISVGMLLNPAFVAAHPEILALVVLLVLLVKFGVCTLVVLLFRYPLRVALFVGASLSQIGEFSFVLAQLGKDLGLIGDYLYQLTLAGTVLTMVLTPQLMNLGRKQPDWLLKLGIPERWIHGRKDEDLDAAHYQNHVIVCGYGPVGEHVTQVLREHNIDCVILELNAARVRNLKQNGFPAYYGDSSSPEVLQHAGLENARAVVVTYADPYAAHKTVAGVKNLSSTTHVVARTRLPEDVAGLQRLGANAVVEEEFEVSLEMSARTLEALGYSRIALETERAAIRRDNYRIFTETNPDLAHLQRLIQTFPDVEIGLSTVHPQSQLAGKTLEEIHLRSERGVTVLSVQKDGEQPVLPSATYRLEAGHTLSLMGTPTDVRNVSALLSNPPAENTKEDK
ncbi:MAG: cation:proton antiporter [bacterium]|nr:cation:proton antiporter [bacterium]